MAIAIDPERPRRDAMYRGTKTSFRLTLSGFARLTRSLRRVRARSIVKFARIAVLQTVQILHAPGLVVSAAI